MVLVGDHGVGISSQGFVWLKGRFAFFQSRFFACRQIDTLPFVGIYR
jgi:hypothetical protein